MIGREPTQQPHHLDIVAVLSFEPPTDQQISLTDPASGAVFLTLLLIPTEDEKE